MFADPARSASEPPSFWAVIPAAGHSRRMGCPKLLLPWGSGTVLSQLIQTLHHPQIAGVMVIHRREDTALYAEIRRCGAVSVAPEIPPPQMLDSLRAGFAELRRQNAPTQSAGWLMLPADYPLLSPGTLASVLAEWVPNVSQIVIPTVQKKRGHPVLATWDWAARFDEIPADQGLNWLFRTHPEAVREVPVTDPGCITDLDTPEDYALAVQDWERAINGAHP